MRLILSLIIATSGGGIAYWLNIPLPWTLGSLFTSIILNISTSQLITVRHGRKLGQFIIGFSLGLYFTHEVVDLIFNNIGLLFVGVLLCLTVSFLIIYCNSFFSSSFPTVYFTYLPGGASEMVNLANKHGGDRTHIAIGHTVRIILLVFSVPFIVKYLLTSEASGLSALIQNQEKFGWTFGIGVLLVLSSALGTYIWMLSKQANPWMLGALIGTAFITYFFDLNLKIPSELLAFSQILLAMALAQPITLCSLRSNLGSLKGMIISSAAAILFLILLSYALTFFFNIDFLTITLGMMPGGISEMSLTAEQLDLNVAIVSTMQTIRLLAVMLIAQPCFVFLLKRLKNKAGDIR